MFKISIYKEVLSCVKYLSNFNLQVCWAGQITMAKTGWQLAINLAPPSGDAPQDLAWCGLAWEPLGLYL